MVDMAGMEFVVESSSEDMKSWCSGEKLVYIPATFFVSFYNIVLERGA